jgi:hypothetical protein
MPSDALAANGFDNKGGLPVQFRTVIVSKIGNDYLPRRGVVSKSVNIWQPERRHFFNT